MKFFRFIPYSAAMNAPDPMPKVPMLNLRSNSIKELRFASKMAFTLSSKLEVDLAMTAVRKGLAYISSVLRILLTRLPLTWTISSHTLWYDSSSISTSV